MQDFFSRVAQGFSGGRPEEGDIGQILGSAGRDALGSAISEAIKGVTQQQYSDHVTPGVGGTDPIGGLGAGQKSDLATTLITTLITAGIKKATISRGSGVSNIRPENMSTQDLASLAQWMQQNHPELLGQAASQLQDKPDLLQGLLGNEALMGAATSLLTGFLADKNR